VDRATIALVRTVMADGWRPDTAADELLLRTQADSRLLRLVRARLSRSMVDRPTRLQLRASATVDNALTQALAREADDMVGTGSPVVPRQGRSHD
jgi:hypothetical protein